MTTLKSVIKKRVKLKKRIPIGIVDAYKLIDQVSVKRTILVSPEFLLEGQTMRSWPPDSIYQQQFDQANTIESSMWKNIAIIRPGVVRLQDYLNFIADYNHDWALSSFVVGLKGRVARFWGTQSISKKKIKLVPKEKFNLWLDTWGLIFQWL